MPLDTSTSVTEGRAAKRDDPTDGHEDISDGVVVDVRTATGDSQTATLFISSKGSVSITVEMSPDGGDTWYAPVDGSPVTLDASGTELLHIDYACSHVRLTADSNVDIRVQSRVRA